MFILLISLGVIVVFVITVIVFMRLPKFGKTPQGKRLEKILASANYKNGKFTNVEHTPDLTEGVTVGKVMREFFFNKNPKVKPPKILPSVKTDLHRLDIKENCMVWFGHSSYFMQVDGRNFLVDPVFSGAASPVKFTTRSFPGSDVYSVNDLPEIDYLFLTHDHWDHLDYETLLKLKPKIKKIITSLGVGQHLERWGFSADIFVENDWNDHLILEEEFTVDTTTARHFSGRGFKRAQAIWSSFVLKTPQHNIFIGGDSGYGKHFKEIGDKFGPFDLAILECGQYNANWKYIHLMPEEGVLAAQELKAEKVIPVHWGKFPLAMHDWDDPIIRFTKTAEQTKLHVFTPRIGECVNIDEKKVFGKWWESL